VLKALVCVYLSICKVHEEKFSGQVSVIKHYIVLFFSFMSFHIVSHEKVFSETMCTQDDVYLLFFPIRFL
jgi:hypothetical protein